MKYKIDYEYDPIYDNSTPYVAKAYKDHKFISLKMSSVNYEEAKKSLIQALEKIPAVPVSEEIEIGPEEKEPEEPEEQNNVQKVINGFRKKWLW